MSRVWLRASVASPSPSRPVRATAASRCASTTPRSPRRCGAAATRTSPARSARRGDLAPLRRLVETPALTRAGVLAAPGETGGAGEGVFYAAACHDFPRVFAYADPPAVRRAAFEQALRAIPARRFAPFSR